MAPREQLLVESGYVVVWVAGRYCRAMRDSQEYLMRWDGEHWLIVSG